MSVIDRYFRPSAVLALGLLVEGCVVAPPTGPNIPVMPGPNKTLGQFQQDDSACRQFASQSIGGAAPAQAANQSAVNSAAAGTVLGAAAGALIGAASGHAGPGAAIGAGAGLLTGTAVGASNANVSGDALQQRYDLAYAQCMSTQGNKLPEAPQQQLVPVYPPGYYGPPPVYYGPPPVIEYGYGYRHRW